MDGMTTLLDDEQTHYEIIGGGIATRKFHLKQGGIIVEKLHEDAELPEQATDHSAGFDFKAYLKNVDVKFRRGSESGNSLANGAIQIHAGERALIPTGLKIQMPPGMECQLRLRSSMAWKQGFIMPHGLGTIDADYPDEWYVLLYNPGPDALIIRHGDRIAQGIFTTYWTPRMMLGEVRRTTNRVGGAGSTGA